MSRIIRPILSISVGHTLPFKDNLKEVKEEAANNLILSSTCPEGEVWEITMIHAISDATGTFHITLKDEDGVEYFGARKETTTFINWDGLMTLVEGDHLEIQCPNGHLFFSMFGTKRYTKKEMEAMIQEIELKFPVQIPEDIQEVNVVKDPKM